MANVTLIDVAKGGISGHSLAAVVGRRSNHGAAEEDVWTGGEATAPVVNKTFPAAAGKLAVVSDSADDTADGTGARTLTIEGLDADWAEIEETVSLNGLTLVNTTKDFLRVNRSHVETVGSGGQNAGELLVSHSVAGLQAHIPAGQGEALMAHRSIPAGVQAFLLQAWAEADTPDALLRLYQRPGASSTAAPRRVALDVRLGAERLVLPARALPAFPPKTDLWMRASIAAGTVYVAAGLDLLLVTT